MSHAYMPRSEKIWLAIGGISLVVFLVVLGILAFGMGLNPPGHMRTIAPEDVHAASPFQEPKLVQTGPREYKATMVAQLFNFLPGELSIPVGSTVHFEITSPDVVHGLLIPNTNVNIMVIPGHITEFTYTFHSKGDYLMLCHEYCGAGHHLMMGRLLVQ